MSYSNAARSLVAGLCLLGCATTKLRSAQAILTPDQAARAIVAAPESANQVWPGFSIDRRNWLVYGNTSAVLFTAQSAPNGFHLLSGTDSTGRMNGRLFELRGRIPDLDGGIRIAHALGDLLITAIPVGATLVGTLTTLYHEAFHAYQGEHFMGDRVDASRIGAKVLSHETAARIEVERRILREAIVQEGTNRDSLVRAFLSVRFARIRNGDPQARLMEKDAERREGTAQLVGYLSAEIALSASRVGQRPTERISADLSIPMKAFGGSPEERLIRLRSYGTGAAMGMLLNAYDADWRGKVRLGAAVDDVLASAMGFDSLQSDELARRILRSFGLDSMLASSDPSWGDLRVMTLADFELLGTHRLVLEFGPMASVSYRLQSAGKFGQGVYRPDRGVTLLPSPIRVAVQDSTGLTLTVEGHPVGFVVDEIARRTTIVVVLAAPPRLNGRELIETSERSDFTLRDAGLVLRVPGAASLNVQGNVITIRIVR